MDIKAQLTAILNKDNYTFEQLAAYLEMSQEALSDGLTHKTLPLRKLELISKALRVPLYSFFRNAEEPVAHEKRYYTNELWTAGDSVKSAQELRTEIDLLKEIIRQKEEQLKKTGR